MSSPSLLPGRIFDTPLVDDKGLVKDQTWRKWFYATSTPAKVPQLVRSTHAKRLTTSAGSYTAGSLFYETDRTTYYIAQLGAWMWYGGMYSVTQQNLPTDLTAVDNNFLAYVSDFAHVLEWNGTGWQWAPTEQGSGMVLNFPDIVPGVGWQLCDGSANVPVLQSDGNYILVTVPNTANNYYRQ